MESLKEQIKHEEELLRLLWITAVVAIGGSISLLLGDPAPLRSGLAGIGFLVSLVFITMILRQEGEIRSLLRQMREKEK
jgi:hypothetical protein